MTRIRIARAVLLVLLCAGLLIRVDPHFAAGARTPSASKKTPLVTRSRSRFKHAETLGCLKRSENCLAAVQPHFLFGIET